MRPLSPLKQKILLILLTGVVLGFTYSPNRQRRIYKAFLLEWKDSDRRLFRRSASDLYRSRLVKSKRLSDGSYSFALTEKGRRKVSVYHFDTVRLAGDSWDGRWRFVCFDIPERLRKYRDIFRKKLCSLGFRELQKSIFIVPYECKNEVDFIVEYLHLEGYVRSGVMSSIDNELSLKKMFCLC